MDHRNTRDVGTLLDSALQLQSKHTNIMDIIINNIEKFNN